MKLTKKGAVLLTAGLVLVTTAVVGVVFGRKKRAAKRLAANNESEAVK